MVSKAFLNNTTSIEVLQVSSYPNIHGEGDRRNISRSEWQDFVVFPWIGEAMRMRDKNANGALQRLENYDCIKAYAVQFQTRGSLLLVAKEGWSESQSVTSLNGPTADQGWVCEEVRCEVSWEISTRIRDLWENPQAWTKDDSAVAYCLSEMLPERCKLQLSLPLAMIVIFFNALKAICMLTMLLRLDEKMSNPPIMNLGDTIVSFLERSDTRTKKLSLRSMDDLRRAMNMAHRWDTRPKAFKDRHRLRFFSASKTRWTLTCLLSVQPLIMIPPIT
tara:strand:+ start:2674 stop:3501 length:828 start_codon:yes stop_codon:yes gene_type:complete